MGNDVKIGSMWFRADDFDAKVNVLTADDDVIRYEYLKRNDDGSLMLGRASHEHFLETFIEWDDDYERFRPGSIWEATRGCGQAAKGKQIKILSLMGDLVEWAFLDNFEKEMDHCTCKSSFLYCFTRIADNDNGAVYRSIKPPIGMVKVKNTKPSFSISPITVHVVSSVEYTEIKPQEDCKSFITNGKDFHVNHELFSMNPEKDFTIPVSKERTISVPNEEETKMENNGTYLKTDASKLEDFGTGAKREDKSGKGRYDLIPGDVMHDFEDYVEKAFTGCEGVIKSPTEVDVSSSAYFNDWQDKNNYYKFIVNVTAWNFVRTPIDKDEMTYVEFRKGFYEMRKALAKHYEEGAKVHGVDNWKKGLPIYGSERGGCFLDSMRRHTDQMLQRKTDEPHAVAALWNAFCAVWTLKHRPHSAMYQNASAVKAEEKPKSTHFDMVDSAIDALKYMSENKNEVLDGKCCDINHEIFDDNFSKTSVNTDSSKLIHEDDEIKKYDIMHQLCYVSYNIYKCIELLRSIVKNDKFGELEPRVKTVYFNIYMIFKMIDRTLVLFRGDSEAIKRISKIITDFYIMINMKVGHIERCCGNIRIGWEVYPAEYLRSFECDHSVPDEDEINILYEMIDRTGSVLLNSDGKGKLDYFRGIGITQSLLDFNTKYLHDRIYKNKK